MLPQITSKLARFLGPKGLMPTTRRGTVVSDVVGAIGGLEGKLEWKGDREGCIRVPIARVGSGGPGRYDMIWLCSHDSRDSHDIS